MTRGRLEAFSDGVIAIIITIMVLELVPPHGSAPEDLLPILPIFLACVLSFANLYAVAIPIAFIAPLLAFGIYVFVAAMWIVPDPRIERRITT